MKGFVISYFYPPINSSEGLVTFKLLKNSRYEYDVFTQNKPLEWSYGNREKELTSENVQTFFAEGDNIEDWAEEAFEFFEKHKDEYSFIMSRSMPPESHEVALRIKKAHPEIKWIASFGDPIADNPYLYFDRNEKNPYKIVGQDLQGVRLRYMLSPGRVIKMFIKELLIRRRNREFVRDDKKMKILQNDVFDFADEIIFNNEFQREYMLKSVKKTKSNLKEKSIVIPHSFDKDLYLNDKKRKNNKITFSYLGHLDNIRNIKPFLRALGRLKEVDNKLSSKIELNIYGKMGDVDKIALVDEDLFDIVKIRKPVKYLESLKIMCNSDWLILIDANLSELLDKNIFFAAKTVDYLGSGSNIFGITMDDGASAEILRETNSILSSYSVDEILMHIKSILEGTVTHETKDQDRYDVVNVVKIYDKMLNKIVGGK